jgi:hypothetical protein
MVAQQGHPVTDQRSAPGYGPLSDKHADQAQHRLPAEEQSQPAAPDSTRLFMVVMGRRRARIVWITLRRPHVFEGVVRFS